MRWGRNGRVSAFLFVTLHHVGTACFAQESEAAQEMADAAKSLTRVSDCTSGDTLHSDDVVVCGRRNRNDRFRLPLKDADASTTAGQRYRGEVPRASTATNPLQPCGLFEGQRRCRKSEAREYGYGGGRDPLSAIVTVGRAILAPDAAIPDKK